MIEWNLNAYQENIGILGMQGCGKTHHAREILRQLPNIPRLIYSPQSTIQNYGEFGDPITKISEIENGKAMLWMGDYSEITFTQINDRIYRELKDCMFVVDDAHEHCTKQSMNKSWQRVIQSKRNDGIFGLYISPAPNLLNNTILQSLKHIFAFRFNLFSQTEWLTKNYFGDEGWLLLDKKVREQNKKVSPIHNEIEFLAKGSYLYKAWDNTNIKVEFSEFQESEIKQESQMSINTEIKPTTQNSYDLNREEPQDEDDKKNGKDSNT